MARFDDKHVLVTGVVIWDGITRPETNTFNGKPKHSLKIAVPANSPDLADLEAIGQAELQQGDLRGQFPRGGHWVTKPVDPGEFKDLLVGHNVVSAGTYNGAPQVFDANGNELPAMAYNGMFYPGARVTVLCHAYTINNAQKGVVVGLDGVQIVDANAPRLDIGSGGIDAAKAFGGGGAAPAAAGQPAPAPAPAPAPTPAPAPAPAPTPAPAPAPVEPAHDFLNPGGGAPTPAPAPAPAPERRFNVGGNIYTEAQLRAGGWNDDQINAAQPA